MGPAEGDEVKANRRIFFDFTIAPRKSVSVVGLFQDARIVACMSGRSGKPCWNSKNEPRRVCVSPGKTVSA